MLQNLPCGVPVEVLASASEFAHGCDECLAVRGPLGGLLDGVAPVISSTGHALIHHLRDDGIVRHHLGPWFNVVNPCSSRLFPQKVAAQVHLLHGNVPAVLDVR